MSGIPPNDNALERDPTDNTSSTSIRKEQVIKILSFVALFALIVFAIFLSKKQSMFHALAYVMLSGGLISIFILSYTLFTTEHLHLIITERQPFVPFNKNIITPYKKITEYDNMPIKSISQMVATHGTSIHFYATFLLSMQDTAIICAAVTKLHDNDMTFDASLVIFCFCAASLALIAMFELNTTDPTDINFILHWTGALGTFLGFPLAFIVQQQCSILSIILMSLACLSNFLFVIVAQCILPNYHSNSVKVHQISRFSMISELFAISIWSISAVLYIIGMADADVQAEDASSEVPMDISDAHSSYYNHWNANKHDGLEQNGQNHQKMIMSEYYEDLFVGGASMMLLLIVFCIGLGCGMIVYCGYTQNRQKRAGTDRNALN
eukprot:36759_1